MAKFVVGVDGSGPSLAAVRWAAAEARLHEATLVLVAAWEFPHALNPVTMFTVEADPFRADAKAALDRAVAGIDAGSLSVEPKIVEGSPALVLVEESADADLVVVGSRGRGGFVGLLLGSVSQHLVAHARCPVLVHHDG